MSIELKMPALSPTMEKGTLSKWLVKVGDYVKPGDPIAEIETDKATMEFEAIDEGLIAKIIVPESSDDIAVGTLIALIERGMDQSKQFTGDAPSGAVAKAPEQLAVTEGCPSDHLTSVGDARNGHEAKTIKVSLPKLAGQRTDISPLAARLAAAKEIDVTMISGSGPGGRILKADLGLKPPTVALAPRFPSREAIAVAEVAPFADVPHSISTLSNMRKTIARRLTESKQQIPHIYLTVDIEFDALLQLRSKLNDTLAGRGIKISINDMIIKALALALIEAPSCNVQFAGDHLAHFTRADISVAVSVPKGLITPVIAGAESMSVSAIASAMKDLAERARMGKLQPREYQGGTASLSNLGMFGVKNFQAVINPPQAMILAIGASERRAGVGIDATSVATIISATGSFDHRAIDGAAGANLMSVFKALIEQPLRLMGQNG